MRLLLPLRFFEALSLLAYHPLPGRSVQIQRQAGQEGKSVAGSTGR